MLLAEYDSLSETRHRTKNEIRIVWLDCIHCRPILPVLSPASGSTEVDACDSTLLDPRAMNVIDSDSDIRTFIRLILRGGKSLTFVSVISRADCCPSTYRGLQVATSMTSPYPARLYDRDRTPDRPAVSGLLRRPPLLSRRCVMMGCLGDDVGGRW